MQPNFELPPPTPAGHPEFDMPSDIPEHNRVKNNIFERLLRHLHCIIIFRAALQLAQPQPDVTPPWDIYDINQIPVRLAVRPQSGRVHYVCNSNHFYYARYRALLQRTFNPSDKSFKKTYGSRSIVGDWVTRPWAGNDPPHVTAANFLIFVLSLEATNRRRYRNDSMDRIHNSTGYAPHLCRWLDPLGQNNNRGAPMKVKPLYFRLSNSIHKQLANMFSNSRSIPSQLAHRQALMDCIRRATNQKNNPYQALMKPQ